MYHFNTKTEYGAYNYDWNQVKVVKLPNGLYCATIFSSINKVLSS